jgi:hypothetical protein
MSNDRLRRRRARGGLGDAVRRPLERDDGYAGGALVGGLGGRPEPPM